MERKPHLQPARQSKPLPSPTPPHLKKEFLEQEKLLMRCETYVRGVVGRVTIASIQRLVYMISRFYFDKGFSSDLYT